MLDSLAFTVRDDRLAFDSASIEQDRDHFVAIHIFLVDREASDSVVRQAPQLPADGIEGVGYVDIMDSFWAPTPPEENEGILGM